MTSKLIIRSFLILLTFSTIVVLLQHRSDLSIFKSSKFRSAAYNLPFGQWVRDETPYNKMEFKTYTDGTMYSHDEKMKDERSCQDLEVTYRVDISEQNFLGADLKKILEKLKEQTSVWDVVQAAKEKFKPVVPEERQWYRFGGSSVWIPDLLVHFMVSRVLFTPSGVPNKSFVSFLYLQVFDKDWKELEDGELRIPGAATTPEYLMNLDGSFTLGKLKTDSKGKLPYPSVLPIEFEYELEVESGKYYYGPEDPRILLITNEAGVEEPLIIFNMKSVTMVKRMMFYYFPFIGKMNYLRKRKDPFAKVEKNWTPFLGRTNSTTKGLTLNFMYSISLLEVLSCELDTGICDYLQKENKTNYDTFGSLRGGTSLMRMPLDDVELPAFLRDKMGLENTSRFYVGWARMHLNNCGCAESMYRPNLMILQEDYDSASNQYRYKLADVSEYVDFHATIPPWITPKIDEMGNVQFPEYPTCSPEVRNVLIPNSIAYWDINSITLDNVLYKREHFGKIASNSVIYQMSDTSGIDHKIEFNDYMALTLSGSDSDVSVVHIRGLLNYLLKLNHLFEKENYETVLSNDLLNLNNLCAEKASKNYCVAYAQSLSLSSIT